VGEDRRDLDIPKKIGIRDMLSITDGQNFVKETRRPHPEMP
jgi:hypothetical protein